MSLTIILIKIISLGCEFNHFFESIHSKNDVDINVTNRNESIHM